MTTSEQDFITRAREYNRQVWNGINNLVELQRQWNALDYSTTLVDEVTGFLAADIGAVVFDTADAMVDVLDAGHATNMAKLL